MKVFAIEVAANAPLEEVTQSAGRILADISEHKDESSLLLLRCEHMEECSGDKAPTGIVSLWERTLRRIEMADCVIVYVSDGDVYEHSFDLLLIADFRILSRGSKIGFGAGIGANAPGMSLYRLANQIGQAQARRMSLAGRVLGADDAYGLGLADLICDGEAEAVDRAVAEFSGRSSSEVAVRRRLLLEAHTIEYDDAVGAYWAARARHRSRAPA